MKRIFFLTLMCVFSLGIYAQGMVDFSDVILETDEDYEKAEPIVLGAANYILNHPADETDVSRIHALQLIMSWMEGYPNYTFSLSTIDKLGQDINAQTAYIAAVAKYYLENKRKNPDSATVEVEAWKIFLSYSEVKENKIKTTRVIKSLNEAEKGNSLREALGL